MTKAELEKLVYNEMKVAAKKRKIKQSAQQNLYKKEGEYFYNTFWYIGNPTDGKISVSLDFSLKYHRFDELEYSIGRPAEPVKFTDKLRANSGIMCRSYITESLRWYDFDGTEEAITRLCKETLDYIEEFYMNFIKEVEEKYGDLNMYFIANKDSSPRLAGLAYIDRGDAKGALECFSKLAKIGYWFVEIKTDEQRHRANMNNMKISSNSSGETSRREMNEQFVDYAIAMMNGLEWNTNRAMYGLLPEERMMK